ncbi:MAG: Hsp20/alpha crystallin family protein [Burkholderiaceae bacterium]
MNNLTRFEREFFPDLFRRFAIPMRAEVETPGEIRVDVTEEEKGYVVRAEIPGAKKDDIRVQVDGNAVSIRADVKKEQESKTGRMLLKETYAGSSTRAFTLAHEIDDKGAVAKLEDGVLTLNLPKRSGAGSRLLPIV